MIGDRYDVEYSLKMKERLAQSRLERATRSANTANNLADTFLRISKLKEKYPGATTTLDAIERNVNAITRDLYRAKSELRQLKGK
jgi:chromosome segregation ATPase